MGKEKKWDKAMLNLSEKIVKNHRTENKSTQKLHYGTIFQKTARKKKILFLNTFVSIWGLSLIK
jgi:hypothetical protein